MTTRAPSGEAALRLALLATLLALATYYASGRRLAWLALAFAAAAFALTLLGSWQRRRARGPRPTGELLIITPDGRASWTPDAELPHPARGERVVATARVELVEIAPRDALAAAARATLGRHGARDARLLAVLQEKPGRAGLLLVELHAPANGAAAKDAANATFARTFADRCRQAGVMGVRADDISGAAP